MFNYNIKLQSLTRGNHQAAQALSYSTTKLRGSQGEESSSRSSGLTNISHNFINDIFKNYKYLLIYLGFYKKNVLSNYLNIKQIYVTYLNLFLIKSFYKLKNILL